MEKKAKITTGANDRPRNETIAQTGPGLPDDSGRAPGADENEVARIRDELTGSGSGGAGQARQDSANPDSVPEGTPDAGENICRRCAGTGRVDGGVCPDCGGTGIVITPVGGGG